MTNKKKMMNLLGLAYKAKKIIVGEENVENALSKGKLKIVYVALDASEKTIDKFNKKCFFYNTPFETIFTSDELASSLGKTLCKIIGVIDEGFYQSLKTLKNEVKADES